LKEIGYQDDDFIFDHLPHNVEFSSFDLVKDSLAAKKKVQGWK